MAYNPTVYLNDTPPAINADNMNKSEQGIATADANATSAKNEVENIRIGFDGKTYSSAGNAMREQISMLNTSSNIINNRFVYDIPPVNVIDGETFTVHENGYYLTSGSFEASSSYDSWNELIDVIEGVTYTIGQFRGYVVAYDSNGQNGVYLITGSDTTIADKSFTIPSGKSKIGISWRNSRVAPTSITRPANINDTPGEPYQLPDLLINLEDISDFEEYKDSVDEKLDLIQFDPASFVPPNIIEGETFTKDVGGLWNSSGTISHNDNTRNYTAFEEPIEVVGGCNYTIMGFRGRVMCFDANMTNGQAFGTTATINFSFTVPENYKYIGVSYSHNSVDAPTVIYRNTIIPADYPNMKIKIEGLSTNGEYKYAGKTFVCFGDSITGNYENPFDYPYKLGQELGIDAKNVGFGGTQMSYSASAAVDAFCMYRLIYAAMNNDFTIQDAQIETSTIKYASEHLATLKAVDWDEIFAVTIAYGTNDIAHGAILDNENNFYDTQTLLGALRYTIKTLQEKYPEIQILVITPMYRYADNWTADCNHRTFIDDGGTEHTYNDYIDGIIGVCKYFGIPVFDTFRNSNINEFTYQYYLKDGTHPKDDIGQKQLSSIFANAIKNAF